MYATHTTINVPDFKTDGYRYLGRSCMCAAIPDFLQHHDYRPSDNLYGEYQRICDPPIPPDAQRRLAASLIVSVSFRPMAFLRQW